MVNAPLLCQLKMQQTVGNRVHLVCLYSPTVLFNWTLVADITHHCILFCSTPSTAVCSRGVIWHAIKSFTQIGYAHLSASMVAMSFLWKCMLSCSDPDERLMWFLCKWVPPSHSGRSCGPHDDYLYILQHTNQSTDCVYSSLCMHLWWNV